MAFDGGSSNGRTRAFEARYHGSNPCPPATKYQSTSVGWYFVIEEKNGFEGRERKRAGVASGAQRPGARVGCEGEYHVPQPQCHSARG